VEQDCSFRQLK